MEAADNAPVNEPKKQWVKFEEDSPENTVQAGIEGSAAIIKAETTQINIDKSRIEADKKAAAVITPETVHINVNRPNVSRPVQPEPRVNKVPESKGVLKNVDLRETVNGRPSPIANSGLSNVSNAVIRQGFANGDIIVTLLPVNTKWPWITPAQFRPELVPEELMAQGLTLTVEDYVHVMELLTNDIRFNLYNICYKRILVLWIFTAFVVLLGLLFSGITGLTLFGLGVMWLVLNAAAIFLCMWLKIKLNHNLEKCLGQVNKQLLKHKIILGLDDRGKISCHKVNLCFIYFDTTDCIQKLQEVIEREEREGRPVNREESADERRNRLQFQQRMDIDDSDIIIQGVNTTRLPRKQERAEMLYLRYSSRWVRQFLRNLLELSVDSSDPGSYPRMSPRHCISARCPCQFIEEHLKYKPRDHCCVTYFGQATGFSSPVIPYLP
ncbi:UNVERIFIED_CONTAM: hypothetical protein PYX00_006285 [Menopon gallinae]|uniref:Transmembrane protein 268 n=1 Tax=Menopon gallinae TaxID=328185 RepID=A0AAW2HUT6_9NEOP